MLATSSWSSTDHTTSRDPSSLLGSSHAAQPYPAGPRIVDSGAARPTSVTRPSSETVPTFPPLSTYAALSPTPTTEVSPGRSTTTFRRCSRPSYQAMSIGFGDSTTWVG